MMRCPPICGKRKQEEKEKKVRKTEKDENEKVLRKLVPRRFWKWKKVFGKKKSERMPVRKTWDHAIELKEGFMPRKRKVYSLSREVREVEFLGVVISPKGAEMQKKKVEGVLSWPVPRNIKEVQKFLGLANYYRRFIENFARIAALLHVLVRKEQK